ncbi:hypothetical protein [Streptacidiphilus sp. P02-A3a]|uniref:hypothetical protein n=1 Tax=Streptacidiphilus sp. P02-A3a TaxID=2704468 RepID=UPI0015F9F205|nr:hypothetical protein [Streptacidiphilus sp. P02-A3a]QMU72145.1 hypothetical protein GXP74_31800 [Streptacidiphilus sp. P02-A3a]
MSETPIDPAEGGAPAGPAGTEPSEADPAGTDPVGAAPADPADGGEPDAEALRKEVEALRKEAAKYRVKSRELSATLATAKTPEEFAEAAARSAALEVELHRERLARKFSLPDELAALVQGDDDDAREAHAKSLARFAVAPVPRPGHPGGGLDPSARTTPTDPAALAAAVPRNRR